MLTKWWQNDNLVYRSIEEKDGDWIVEEVNHGQGSCLISVSIRIPIIGVVIIVVIIVVMIIRLSVRSLIIKVVSLIIVFVRIKMIIIMMIMIAKVMITIIMIFQILIIMVMKSRLPLSWSWLSAWSDYDKSEDDGVTLVAPTEMSARM